MLTLCGEIRGQHDSQSGDRKQAAHCLQALPVERASGPSESECTQMNRRNNSFKAVIYLTKPFTELII